MRLSSTLAPNTSSIKISLSAAVWVQWTCRQAGKSQQKNIISTSVISCCSGWRITEYHHSTKHWTLPHTMRVLLVTFCFLLFRGILFGQALMDFDHPMIDNTVAFFGGTYDTALLRKNNVESCLQKNHTFYFNSKWAIGKKYFCSIWQRYLDTIISLWQQGKPY